MATFDISAARKDGIPDEQIAAHLSRQKDFPFDVARALKDGNSPTDVLNSIERGQGSTEKKPVEEKPAPAAEATQKPFGEKLKSFLGNVTPEGPISGLIALTRLAGDASKGKVDLMTDQGIARAMPAVVEGSVAAAPSARARPMPSTAKVPVPEAPPPPPPPPAPPAEGGGFMSALTKYGIPLAAEAIGTAHGLPGVATIGRLTAQHLLSKIAGPKEAAPPPLTSRYEGVPDIADAVKPQAPAAPPEAGPAPFVNQSNPALVKAREQAQVMNALAELAKQSKAKQQQGAMNTSALEAARDTPMSPGIARLTDPAAEMRAGALEGAAGTPMAPGVARLNPPAPEPAPAPVPAPTALTRDVVSQGKLLSSGLAKVQKMREQAAKAEASPIEKIAIKAKAPKPKSEPEGFTLEDSFDQPSKAAGDYAPTVSDYAHMDIPEAARHIVDAQKAKGIKFWHGEDSYLKATRGRLAAKEVIASDLAQVIPSTPAKTIRAWVQGTKNRADAARLKEHLKTIAPKSASAIDRAFTVEGLKQGWSK